MTPSYDRRKNADNSFGLGDYPLPPKLRHLGNFMEVLRPTNFVDHKVWPKEGYHMVTVKVTPRFDVLAADLKTLLRLGLHRIQSHSPGEMSFYFFDEKLLTDKPIETPVV